MKLQFWRKPQTQNYEVLAKYDLSETREGDRIVIEQLQKNGADLSKPREVKHYLFVPTAQCASQAATELRNDGYEVEERTTTPVGQDSSNPFLVLARKGDLVNLQSVEEMRQHFEKLAVDCGGEYDGWEAAALP
jgi:regulator of RNase E activity RraB